VSKSERAKTAGAHRAAQAARVAILGSADEEAAQGVGALTSQKAKEEFMAARPERSLPVDYDCESDIESSARGRKRLAFRLAHFLDDVLKRFGFRGFLESKPLKIACQAVDQPALVPVELR
jgi:hypothetical protein